ncbi:MAG: hypothetical protein J6Z32_01720 [Bacteroidales bacterium]|nr:hypothetical protein [Bacteroidales bacterium]
MKDKQKWFKEKLKKVSPEIKMEMQLSAEIIAKIDSILKEKNITQRELAKNLTLRSIAELSVALGEPLICVNV